MKKLNLFCFGLLLTMGTAIVALNSCSKDDDPVAVTGISLDKSTLTLLVGKEETLTATVTPDNAADKTVTWTSSDNSKATVANGKVTAKAVGTTTITAKAGEKTATCIITVTSNAIAVTGISLNKSTLPLLVGEEENLLATITPDNATDKTVTWTSSDNSKATVANGKVTAVAVGTTTITAKAGDKTATCIITVNPKTVVVTGISLDKATFTLAVNEDFTLTATVTPSDATDKTVVWTSDKEAVAKVNNTGKVTSVTEGTATITAKAGAETATCTVTVKGVRINGVVWATRNVAAAGAFAAKPEDAGMFYQWNRKTAWASTGTVTGWKSDTPTGTTWEKGNDPSPAGWRVPTLDEIKKLFDTDKVKNEWTTAGREFTDKTTGNSIFLPAAGCRDNRDGTLYYVGLYGYYWSSTPHEGGSSNACSLGFGSDDAGWYSNFRSHGFSVRSVADN